MSIVTADATDPAPDEALLDVVVVHGRDAEAATAGGADRLLLAAHTPGGLTVPEPGAVSAVVRETDLPVWVFLGGADQEPSAMVRLGLDAIELGAAGFAFGRLDRDLEIDRYGCADLVAGLEGMPWLFHGFDSALEPHRAWRDVLDLPGLAGVFSAGSTRGLGHGGEDLLRRVAADPAIARLLVAAGGLTPDLVPWFLRSGVRRFAIGTSARDGASWRRGSVDPARVRAWRMLLDDALSRALGIPVE